MLNVLLLNVSYFLLYSFGGNVQYIYAQKGKYFQGNMDTISHITQHIETGKIIE